jgi:predicted anti-sigma-YlaC factor YlaD
MTPMMDCSEARLSLGVYVLGAIDPAERALVDSHLARCRGCRDELASLAALPALLARVSTEEAIALAASDPRPAWEEEVLEPPDRLVATVLDLTAARRRRRRWRESLVAVAAALVIAAGVFGGLRMTAPPASSQAGAGGSMPYVGAPSGAWQLATGQSHGMNVTVKYVQMSWGTLLTSKVSGVPAGTTCQIWVVVPGKGGRILAGSWKVGYNEGSVWYPASAAVSADSVQKFVVTVSKTQSITADS